MDGCDLPQRKVPISIGLSFLTCGHHQLSQISSNRDLILRPPVLSSHLISVMFDTQLVEVTSLYQVRYQDLQSLATSSKVGCSPYCGHHHFWHDGHAFRSLFKL